MEMKPDDQEVNYAAVLEAAAKDLPERVAMTAAEYEQKQQRDRFMRDADVEFTKPIDRALLIDPVAFDAVAKWDGQFPGPIAHGPTGTSKTRAAWYALGRFYILEGRSIRPFTAKELCSEFDRYDRTSATEYWFRRLEDYSVLFVDDLEKINWQFQSNVTALWEFFNWVYKRKRPCVVTSNKGREWWTEKMDEAFARRLFAKEVVFRGGS